MHWGEYTDLFFWLTLCWWWSWHGGSSCPGAARRGVAGGTTQAPVGTRAAWGPDTRRAPRPRPPRRPLPCRRPRGAPRAAPPANWGTRRPWGRSPPPCSAAEAADGGAWGRAAWTRRRWRRPPRWTTTTSRPCWRLLLGSGAAWGRRGRSRHPWRREWDWRAGSLFSLAFKSPAAALENRFRPTRRPQSNLIPNRGRIFRPLGRDNRFRGNRWRGERGARERRVAAPSTLTSALAGVGRALHRHEWPTWAARVGARVPRLPHSPGAAREAAPAPRQSRLAGSGDRNWFFAPAALRACAPARHEMCVWRVCIKSTTVLVYIDNDV